MTSGRLDPPPDPTAAPPAGLGMADLKVRNTVESVEAHSASLKKELGVRDLALTQILFIVGLTWIGVAGELGPAHDFPLLPAPALFFFPPGLVGDYPNRPHALPGGL